MHTIRVDDEADIALELCRKRYGVSKTWLMEYIVLVGAVAMAYSELPSEFDSTLKLAGIKREKQALLKSSLVFTFECNWPLQTSDGKEGESPGDESQVPV